MRALALALLGLAAAARTPPGRPCARAPARPLAAVGRISAKLTAVADVATFRQLLDEKGMAVGQLDVRGDTSVLRDKAFVHPVLAAIRARAAAGSRPGARTDGMRIGLAIEGGGMRGAVGAGMVAALHELGFGDAFDAVYGSSAGALVGAYFISKQLPRFGPSVYYECLGNSGKAFINPIQLVRSVGLGALQLKQWLRSPRSLGPPALNLDFLLNDVMQHVRPLDWPVFWERNRDVPLRVLASGLDTQRPYVMGSREGHFRELSELALCLRASMLLPGITGPPILLPSSMPEPLADAVLTEPIPYRAAVAEGCTHVLVLRTQPDGKKVSKGVSLGEALIARCARTAACRAARCPRGRSALHSSALSSAVIAVPSQLPPRPARRASPPDLTRSTRRLHPPPLHAQPLLWPQVQIPRHAAAHAAVRAQARVQ